MRQLDYAKSIVLEAGFVREGKIKIFPQMIINDLEEFNNKFETSLTHDSYSHDIMEYLRKIYNDYTFFDYSQSRHKTKEWFNEQF